MKLFKVTILRLVTHRLQAGYLFGRRNFRLKPYLLGWKGSFNFFNLKPAVYQTKLLLSIIIQLISKRQKILVVNHYQKSTTVKGLLRIPRLMVAEGAWMGGLLTNCKDLQLASKTRKYFNLPRLRTLPSLVVLLNMLEEDWALKEAVNLNIPAFAVTGSSVTSIGKILYPIVCESSTSESRLFYSLLIKNATLAGFIAERLRLLK